MTTNMPHVFKSETYAVETPDQTEILLTRFRGSGKNGVVFLTHGLSLSTNMFTLGEHRNVVEVLLEEGFSEVWLLDNRGSSRLHFNDTSETNTLDHIGLYDIPAAFAKIERVTGVQSKDIHAIGFCVGSTALFISLLSRALPRVKSLIAVQAGPVLSTPFWSKVKLNVAVPALKKAGINSLSPELARSKFLPKRMLAKAIKYAHRAEDAAPAMISFLSGSGYPAVYQPRNLAEQTRTNILRLFGSMPFSYHDQIRRIVQEGFLVKSGVRELERLADQDDYVSQIAKLDFPILFVSSEHARVFPESNLQAYQIFEAERPGRQKYLNIADYGHLDVFIGMHADRDVFPHFVKFLKAEKQVEKKQDKVRRTGGRRIDRSGSLSIRSSLEGPNMLSAKGRS